MNSSNAVSKIVGKLHVTVVSEKEVKEIGRDLNCPLMGLKCMYLAYRFT